MASSSKLWSSLWGKQQKNEPPKTGSDGSLWSKASQDVQSVSKAPAQEQLYGFNGKWLCPKTGRMVFIRGTQVFWDSSGASSFEFLERTRIRFQQCEKTYEAELDIESQKVTWTTGDHWIRFWVEEVQNREEEFLVTIVNRRQGLGFDYRASAACLTVKKVHEHGIMATWNKNNAPACVEAGDKVIEVNGQKISALDGSKKVDEIVRESDQISLLVRKPWHTVQRHANS
eukprot:TRINITY_DN22781_c0_g1_i1.p1 TRINITY_DN22781_c0_g1~~TRINITY_DN22781_c0_g1_i1.p1  ORF type:complete len:229 (+),score=38.42 TRINITY_DN22781_c0_g1_i1:97-783(+)